MRIYSNTTAVYMLLIILQSFLGCSPQYEFYVNPKNSILSSCNKRVIKNFTISASSQGDAFSITCKRLPTEVDLSNIDSLNYEIISIGQGKIKDAKLKLIPNIKYSIDVCCSGDRDGYEIEVVFDNNNNIKQVENEVRNCWD